MGWWVTERAKDIERFYYLLERLEKRVGGKRTLQECCRHMNWPHRGVYFFFEDGEYRNDSDGKLRVVRIGTTTGKNTVLWDRLGSHRSDRGVSVFRDHVGSALKTNEKSNPPPQPHNHRKCVSNYMRNMPFLWLKVFERDGQRIRNRIERNAVAMLSNYHDEAIDKPSESWLGTHRGREDEKVSKSGLWNVHYVSWRTYDSAFINDLNQRIDYTSPLVPCPEC